VACRGLSRIPGAKIFSPDSRHPSGEVTQRGMTSIYGRWPGLALSVSSASGTRRGQRVAARRCLARTTTRMRESPAGPAESPYTRDWTGTADQLRLRACSSNAAYTAYSDCIQLSPCYTTPIRCQLPSLSRLIYRLLTSQAWFFCLPAWFPMLLEFVAGFRLCLP